MLVAGGTGTDPYAFIVLTFDIPFGPTLYSTGSAVTHAASTPYFVIAKTGNYQIDYQISADNPVIETGLPIDITVTLISDMNGVLDTIHFAVKKQLVQKRLLVHLTSGDRLRLQASQPVPSEMRFNSQVMTIVYLD